MGLSAQSSSRLLGPGDQLGKYELIRQVAIGGMAELYLARTQGIEGFEKLVVCKRILPQYVTNASFVNMFLNEARLAAGLHHPNIAQVFDIGVEQGDYFFSMEYIHGEDLNRIAVTSHDNGVPLSLDAALTLACGLCAGLHYAHEKLGTDGKPLRIVHRDVSPSNVLVTYDGAVKLVDFGIARASVGPSTQTGKSTIKGKVAYMSPEQCRGKPLDRRSDLFSVGTILYELTTGTQPFTGKTHYETLERIVGHDPEPPSKLVPSYPEALERIVLKALSRDPEERYATALALQGDLEDFAHESRLRVSPLVLARVMSTLFPARLEEWERARKQGAFFVEQAVVRTLIEKTGEGLVPADPPAGEPVPPPAEDTTARLPTPPPILAADVQWPASTDPHTPRLATPPHGTRRPMPRAASATPAAIDVPVAYAPASVGVIASHPQAMMPPAPSAHYEETKLVRVPSRRFPFALAVGGGAIVAGVLAALIVFGSQGKSTTPVQPRAATNPTVVPPPAAPDPTTPPPAVVEPPPPPPAPPPEVKPEAKPVEAPKPAEPPVRPPAPPPVQKTVKKPVVAPPAPPPAPKITPKRPKPNPPKPVPATKEKECKDCDSDTPPDGVFLPQRPGT